MNYLYLQLRKIFRRSDVLISFIIFAILPIIIAILIINKSNIITIGASVFSGVGYMTVILGLFKSLFMVCIFLCLFSTATVSGEIDTGVDNIYFAKIAKRSQIMLPKLFALTVVGTCIIVLILLSSFAGWEIFIKGSDYGTKSFMSEHHDENVLFLAMTLLTLMENIVLILAFSLISLYISQGKALTCSFMLVIIFKLLGNLEHINNFIPTYLGDGSNLYDLVGDKLVSKSLYDGGILLIYIAVLLTVVTIKYKKMDLVR